MSEKVGTKLTNFSWVFLSTPDFVFLSLSPLFHRDIFGKHQLVPPCGPIVQRLADSLPLVSLTRAVHQITKRVLLRLLFAKPSLSSSPVEVSGIAEIR